MEVLSSDVVSFAQAADKRAACEELWRRYHKEMLSWAISELRGQRITSVQAGDVVQEVFAKLLHAAVARNFLGDRPLRPWLIRVLRNQTRDLLRQEYRQPPGVEEQHLAACPSRESAEPDSSLQELDALLHLLTEEERRLVQLFYLQENSASEVGAATGQDVQAVYRQLARIREKLRSLLPLRSSM